MDASVTETRSGVSVAKLQNTRHDVARRGLAVAPSAFVHPHLYVADVPGHPVDAGPSVPSVAGLVTQFETVANRGRLEVARAIATEPRTAGEIAALWHVDPTLVNRHLRALAAAGLATTVRRGRYVQYRLDTSAVERLGSDLVRLLLRCRNSSVLRLSGRGVFSWDRWTFSQWPRRLHASAPATTSS